MTLPEQTEWVNGREIRARFWMKVRVAPANECWEWLASRDRHGYGKFKPVSRTWTLAHRASYRLHVGPIPDGLVLDHLCRNTSCVNPGHLEAVTQVENMRRGVFPNSLKTECPQGHPYNEENTAVRGGRRFCLACRRAKHAARDRSRAGRQGV